MLTEAYLSGNPEQNRAILKISPGRKGSSASYYCTDRPAGRNDGRGE
ncbi:hypothetical protein ACFYOV_15285 [Streptomyces sp. NPDC005931]